MTTITQLSIRRKDGKLYRLVEIRNYEPNAKERLTYKYQVEYSYMYPTTYFFKNQEDAEKYGKEEYIQYRGSGNNEFIHAMDVTVPMTGGCSVEQWNSYPTA